MLARECLNSAVNAPNLSYPLKVRAVDLNAVRRARVLNRRFLSGT